MSEWACQRCREAFWGHPPESGLCTACEQASQDDQEVAASDQ